MRTAKRTWRVAVVAALAIAFGLAACTSLLAHLCDVPAALESKRARGRLAADRSEQQVCAHSLLSSSSDGAPERAPRTYNVAMPGTIPLRADTAPSPFLLDFCGRCAEESYCAWLSENRNGVGTTLGARLPCKGR
jgi:hypothetical protein